MKLARAFPGSAFSVGERIARSNERNRLKSTYCFGCKKDTPKFRMEYKDTKYGLKLFCKKCREAE